MKKLIFLIIFLSGAFFVAFVIPVTAMWGIGLGVLCAMGASPKTDRRFKTGYKNNEEINGSLLIFGLSWAAISILGLMLFWDPDIPVGESSPASQSVRTQSMQPIRSQHIKKTGTTQDSAISLLNQMIAIAEDDGGVGRAEELYSLKQQIDALPKPAQGDKQRARMANAKGLVAYKVEQYEQAKKYFLSAYQADPTDAEIAGNLALVYLNLGDSKKVIETLTTALTLASDRASSWFYLAMYYSLQDQQQAAVACYALTYHFSPDRNGFVEILQELADGEQYKVRQATQQALQLSLFQKTID